MKKVLIINLGKEYGGAETLIRNIIHHIDEVEVLLCVDKNGQFYNKDLRFKNNILICSTKNIHYISSIFKIIKYVKNNKIDVIHTHGTPSNIVGIICKLVCKCKFIVTIHSDLDYDFSGNKLKIYKIVEKMTCRFSDQIVTVSKDLSNKLSLRNIKNEINIIHNGIKANVTSIERKTKNVFTFLFVGRLSEVKNIELLLDGMNYLKTKLYSFECFIVGDGEQKERLMEITDNYGLVDCVHFVGFKDDVSSYMKKADLLLVTSRMEGIPLVIIEAFANKLPVLASRVGGIKEIITDELNGILFDVNNPSEFYQKLEEIIKEQKNLNMVRENAYEDYCEKWNIECMIQKYILLYKQ